MWSTYCFSNNELSMVLVEDLENHILVSLAEEKTLQDGQGKSSTVGILVAIHFSATPHMF
jgi:hypothetical protein